MDCFYASVNWQTFFLPFLRKMWLKICRKEIAYDKDYL